MKGSERGVYKPMKKTYIFFYSCIVFIAVAFFATATSRVSKREKPTVSVNDETEVADSEILICARNYDTYGMWYDNSHSSGYDDGFYDDNHIYFSSGTEKGLYNISTARYERLCRKKGCIHTSADCINNIRLTFVNVKNGEVVGRSRSSDYEIIRIIDYDVYSDHISSEPIIGIWCYNNWVYYSTDYATYRYDIDNPKKAFKVLDRPINYTYLFFYDDKMFYIDDSEVILSANLDGTEEVEIVSDLSYMLELQGERLYYLKSADRSLYSNNFDGTDEKKEVEGKLWRYLVANDGIYYFKGDELDFRGDLYLKKFDDSETKITELVAGIRMKNENYMLVEKERTQLTDEEKEHPEDTSIKLSLYSINLNTKELTQISIIGG